MQNKKILILYQGDDWQKEAPFENSPETRVSFESFYDFARERGWDTYRASIQWLDQQSFSFVKSWTYQNKKWEKGEEKIVPDAIFDKMPGKYDYASFALKMRFSQTIPVINSPLFRAAFDNKFAQYLAFGEYMPFTLLSENQQQLEKILERIPTEKAVAKEVYGSGGKEVRIEKKDDLKKMGASFCYPVIVQEFIETSGIPNISVKGTVADLRIVYVGDQPVYALTRIAKKDSFFTNFHQGARALLIPLERVPQDCFAVCNKIIAKLSLFENTHYSLDFMFTKTGKPIFIEMNTTPGFDLLKIVGTPEIRDAYYQKLIDSFQKNV